uniref:Major facilitator superfamily (MFS) profile domain-containing protein n=1 Tax=Rhodnius prolixus TaxID=13249 RepID=T1HKF4_RHOPR
MKVVKFFDLDLLKDGVYRNIWLGMSLAFTGEINFSLMTPLILGDRNFNIEETATLMSVIATADIIFRFLAPFIGDRMKITPRYMYMLSLVLLVIARFSLTFVYNYKKMLVVCVALGLAKGFRTVYMTLVIPNHVPLEKLPSASGLQTVLNGIFLMGFGPIVGWKHSGAASKAAKSNTTYGEQSEDRATLSIESRAKRYDMFDFFALIALNF